MLFRVILKVGIGHQSKIIVSTIMQLSPKPDNCHHRLTTLTIVGKFYYSQKTIITVRQLSPESGNLNHTQKMMIAVMDLSTKSENCLKIQQTVLMSNSCPHSQTAFNTVTKLFSTITKVRHYNMKLSPQ